MRILFVINGLGTGGAERSLHEILAWEPDRISPVVACLNRRAEGVQASAIGRGLDVRFVSGDRASAVRGLRRLIGEVSPSLVHTTIFEADIAGRLAAAGSTIPVLTSLVNTSYGVERRADPAVSRWKMTAARLADGWTARHLTTHFHAISGAVRDSAIRDLHIAPSRITVIERGRDPSRLGRPSSARRESARARLGLDGRVPVVITVGRQEFQKGQWHLIDAFAKVRANVPDVCLLIAGRTGNATRRIQEAIGESGLGSAVHLLGHRDDVPELLAASDLFVFPSLYEGLGGALIEAMALQLPIVASDLPAIREVVQPGRNADLVPVSDVDSLANAMLALLRDPERGRAYGARGRRIFEQRFTLERSATRMVELFERVAASGRR